MKSINNMFVKDLIGILEIIVKTNNLKLSNYDEFLKAVAIYMAMLN